MNIGRGKRKDWRGNERENRRGAAFRYKARGRTGVASLALGVAMLLLSWFPAAADAGEEVPRPTQLTLTNKTASSVTLLWGMGTNRAAGWSYEVIKDGVLAGTSTSNTFLCTGLIEGQGYVFRVRARDGAGNVSQESNALLATPQSGVTQVQPLIVRTQFHALVLNYDAHILVNGMLVKASEYYNFRNVDQLIEQYISLLRRASGGQTTWSVVDRYDLDGFAPSADTTQMEFSASNYLALRAQDYNYDVSYDRLIHDPRFGLVEKINAGKVDAIWVFGMPGINFWETAMAGPNPYWVNGAPTTDSALRRNVVFYGFGKAPHQGVGFMCENTCHMTENIMGRISANWPRTVAGRVFQTLNWNDPNRVLVDKLINDWTHFTQAEAASWDPMLVAPGNAQAGLSHYPPTALYNYDWSTMNLDFSGTGPFQECAGEWAIVGNEYRALAGNSATTVAMDGANPQAFSGADVELTVRVTNNSFPSYAGLMFRLSSCRPGPNQANGYFIGLNAWEKRVVLAKLANQFIALTNAPYDVRANYTHRLRVEARGSLIQVFLDGNLAPLISANDTNYITGGFGLSSYFTDAFFGNLKIVPHVVSTADKWYRYPQTNATARDLTPLEWNGEGTPAMDGFYAWWWEHLPKNGGSHNAADLGSGVSEPVLNTWWPYIFDINRFTSTRPAPDIQFAAEDLNAPAAPQQAVGLALGASRIGLSWSEPDDDVGVTRYEIFRDGVLLGKTPVTHLIDTRLLPDTAYTYQIRACDGSANVSGGTELRARTLAADNPGIVDGGFEFPQEITGWTTEAFAASSAQMSWEPPGSGRNGTRCVSIESSNLNDARWIQTVGGLRPGETYWLTGWIRGLNVVREPGRNTGANLCLEGTWTHAPDYLDGTFDWTQASFSFTAPPSGSVTIGCRLGYWSNTTRGKVWFDDIAVVQTGVLKFDQVRMASGNAVRLALLTEPQHRYRLEKSGDLKTWTEVQSFGAMHPLTEIQEVAVAGENWFYRAARLD